MPEHHDVLASLSIAMFAGVVGLKLEYDSPDTTSLQTCWYRYYLLWSLSS